MKQHTKEVIVFILLSTIVVVYSTILYVTEEVNQDEITVNQYNNCPDFNGRDFLLTGGSSKPQTTEEVNYELMRLNWLCNGGSR